MVKTLNLNVLGTERIPIQRPHRFQSVGDYIHATPISGYAWVTPGHTVTGGS